MHGNAVLTYQSVAIPPSLTPRRCAGTTPPLTNAGTWIPPCQLLNFAPAAEARPPPGHYGRKCLLGNHFP